jgi:hypothetical protein
MANHIITRRSKALGIIACAITLATAPAVPLGAQSAWSRVPAFPKGCFQKDDTFTRDADRVLDEITQATYKQDEANAAVKAKFDEIDGGTRQSRMMAFLQKDPANAAKYMQDMTAGAAKQQEMVQASSSKGQALRERFRKLQAEHRTEADQVLAFKGKAMEQLEPGGDPAKARAFAAQFDAAYPKLCEKWYTSSSSPFLTYLGELKQFMVDAELPAAEEAVRLDRVNFKIFGIPDAGYASTAELKAVSEYLKVARTIFDLRVVEAWPGSIKPRGR